MKRLVIIIFLLSISLAFADHRSDIYHAETYYWLGINEHGDMQAEYGARENFPFEQALKVSSRRKSSRNVVLMK